MLEEFMHEAKKLAQRRQDFVSQVHRSEDIGNVLLWIAVRLHEKFQEECERQRIPSDKEGYRFGDEVFAEFEEREV